MHRDDGPPPWYTGNYSGPPENWGKVGPRLLPNEEKQRLKAKALDRKRKAEAAKAARLADAADAAARAALAGALPSSLLHKC